MITRHLPAPRKHYYIIGAVIVVLAITAYFFVFAKEPEASYTTPPVEEAPVEEPIVEEVLPEQKVAPNAVKGIYMSQCVVGTKTFRESLVSLVEQSSELNAVVIDIKDFSGTIAFQSTSSELASASLVSCGARDMKEFVAHLKEKNIWTIARITVFQDPHYTKQFPHQAVQSVSRPGEPWRDGKGLNFVDVSSKPFWDYIITLSKETIALGFDELNYDYIRYPSDGVMSDTQYINPNKQEALELFFKYLHEHIEPTGVVMSADLFGMTASNFDDLGIGQVLERALPYFDYIMPMVYPSHYPKLFNGYSDPNLYPYEIIKYAMDKAVARTIATSSTIKTLDSTPIMNIITIPASSSTPTTTKEVFTGKYTKEAYSASKIRPWLQDFDYGKNYLPADITAQNKGTYDAGLSSWIYWDPSNKYDSLRQAVQ
jgi:hypothetical protein